MFWKTLVITLLLSLYAATANADERPVAPERIEGAIIVSAEELIKLIFSNPDIILIDSRKHDEYVKGHIEGAINILNTKLTLPVLQSVSPDTAAVLVFYCNGPRCLRSSNSASKALSWGYHNIFWFRGGWAEWHEKRFPVVTGNYASINED